MIAPPNHDRLKSHMRGNAFGSLIYPGNIPRPNQEFWLLSPLNELEVKNKTETREWVGFICNLEATWSSKMSINHTTLCCEMERLLCHHTFNRLRIWEKANAEMNPCLRNRVQKMTDWNYRCFSKAPYHCLFQTITLGHIYDRFFTYRWEEREMFPYLF